MPLGASPAGTGVNFAVYAPHAHHAWLALFDDVAATEPYQEVELSRPEYLTGDIWGVHVDGLEEGALYAWRFEGGRRASRRLVFVPDHYLLDPYARSIVNLHGDGPPKSVVVAGRPAHDVSRPNTPLADTVIYELHVRGFTQHESSGVESRGRYRGIIERIPHLQSLGVTAVELMPVHACGEHETGYKNPKTGEALINYWGYNTIGFFAPDPRFASGQGAAVIDEVRELVRALHEAGIEVYLDVVYNHTAEGGKDGPTLSFRGIDTITYYLLDKEGKYIDFTGCGNTVNCQHAVTSDLIVDSLRYWVTEIGVDGFRFDIASVLNRDSSSVLHKQSELIKRISNDAVLRDVKLIAEAWDAAGGYQVGTFGSPRWLEWNDRFRDDVRKFWRGDPNMVAPFASRITGSADIYEPNGKGPHNSVNFVAAHDGFTTRDVVSYNHKHNHRNGEKNRDGHNHNYSWNCGTEGDTDNDEINELRLRLQKSLIATVYVSLGVPMLLMGDEMGRTQFGNNNAYCQDNEVSWLNWENADLYKELLEFTRNMSRFRKEHSVFARDYFFTGDTIEEDGRADITWYDFSGNEVDWDEDEPTLACNIHRVENDGVELYMMFNPTLIAREFFMPEGEWRLRVHTGEPAPRDFYSGGDAPLITSDKPFIVGRKAIAICTQPA